MLEANNTWILILMGHNFNKILSFNRGSRDATKEHKGTSGLEK